VQAKAVLYLWDSRLKLFTKHYPAWKLLLAKRLIALGMNRKIQQARRDKLSNEVIQAYETVREMALA
jgi:hypothetical protein